MSFIINYDNIPRKKTKFINFIKNSLRIRDEQLINKIWTIFEDAIQKNQNICTNGNESNKIEHSTSFSNTKRNIEEVEAVNSNNGKKQKTQSHKDREIKNSENKKIKMIKVVKSILVDYNNQMSIKKLRKKVLKYYYANGLTDDTEINRKFDKITNKTKFNISDNLITYTPKH